VSPTLRSSRPSRISCTSETRRSTSRQPCSGRSRSAP
jgi:hypothetical protein